MSLKEDANVVRHVARHATGLSAMEQECAHRLCDAVMDGAGATELGAYELWVVNKFADGWGCSIAEVLNRLLLMWITDHARNCDAAGASMSEYRYYRDGPAQRRPPLHSRASDPDPQRRSSDPVQDVPEMIGSAHA